jgi:hypothetical protein
MLRGMAAKLETLADELHVNGATDPSCIYIFLLSKRNVLPNPTIKAPVPPDHHASSEELLAEEAQPLVKMY